MSDQPLTLPERPAGRHTLDGAILTLLAEALLLPTGLVTAALITRRLDASGFGLFSLAVSTITWFEWTLASIFSRSTVKLIGDADDWRPLGSAIVRLMGLTGLGAGVLLWLLAEPLSALLNEPQLAGLLRLFALDLPLFFLGQAHRQILIGLGQYRQRAVATAAKWLARLVLIVLLVELGFGVSGAIVGNIISNAVELVIGRWYVRPPLRTTAPFIMGQFWEYSIPLFLSAMSLRFYDRLDLFALKIFGGTAAQAGLYSAAQRLALIPSFLSLSLSPLLLSTITSRLRSGDSAAAARLGSQSARGVLWLAPWAAVGAGAANEIVPLAFGAGFAGSAQLLGPLVFAVLALLLISISVSVLTAHSRPRLVLAITGPLMPLAVVAHSIAIPRLGPLGAALVTLGVALTGAIAALVVTRRQVGLRVPLATFLRCAVVSALAYGLAVVWPASGVMLFFKLGLLSVVCVLALAALGEFSRTELAWAWTYAQRPLRAAFSSRAREA